jgi:hypothetical protein
MKADIFLIVTTDSNGTEHCRIFIASAAGSKERRAHANPKNTQILDGLVLDGAEFRLLAVDPNV